MRRLAIVGASGHGKVVADCAEVCGWDEVVFFDDAWPARAALAHWSVEGNAEVLLSRLDEFQGVVVAIGNNAIRRDKCMLLVQAGASLVNIVHPSATISRYAQMGNGTVVFAGAVVNMDAQLGMGCIVNTGACIDHDCLLGDFVHVSPNAALAGGVTVGDLSWIGMGAVARPLVHIGREALIGAGAAVVSDVPENATVVGVPAKPI
ncbi:acetyltransferase [Halopseudomonas pelagia]|uniref:acetyltransferase n=1 Tax=Halopseudomonas pelagia TaxID=553151 RepID=UPI0030D99EFE|tara:strand:+ start:34461 stop:35078 length:618 start_codon:yes stop_codon:yes gene_type:complete